MKLADLIRKREPGNLATAIPAIPATQATEERATVARIATVAVANPTNAKPAIPETVAQKSAACWCWWLAFSETEHKIIYCHPDATHAEVLERYPGVLVAEPYDPPKTCTPQTDGDLIEF